MKFRTSLPDTESSLKINHTSKLLAMGSCFADRIGEILLKNKFPIEINPLGICYNPISIIHQISWMLGKVELSPLEFQESQARWHSFDLHSRWSHADKSALAMALSASRKKMKLYLAEAKVLILTFGTARVYKRKDTGAIVANNYAYPAAFFDRELIGAASMQDAISPVIEELHRANPNLQILLSVSPVRHIRDGLEENAISKANLRILCQQLVEEHEQVHYFPAYEIMMDDLRDYRYYKADLIHPNEQAEAYIWEFFIKKHITPASNALLETLESIQRDLAHKAFNPSSPAHQTFLHSILKKIENLPPEISFEEEKKNLLEQLGDL